MILSPILQDGLPPKDLLLLCFNLFGVPVELEIGANIVYHTVDQRKDKNSANNCRNTFKKKTWKSSLLDPSFYLIENEDHSKMTLTKERTIRNVNMTILLSRLVQVDTGLRVISNIFI